MKYLILILLVGCSRGPSPAQMKAWEHLNYRCIEDCKPSKSHPYSHWLGCECNVDVDVEEK